MNHIIDIQNATPTPLFLDEERICALAQIPLREQPPGTELTLRFVTPEEITELNHTYRNKNKATNVLAFPMEAPPVAIPDYHYLGDIVICPEVLAAESTEQNKSLEEHWTLIIFHGILHLLGFDHVEDEDAKIMQGLEIQLLAEQGYKNPYDIEEDYDLG
ncbi:MAG: rRNA maturation RNase YbeY [Legionella sp. 40-6]|nr:rRNA maturation RNase YbeY [Legionella sp.]OJY28970.1 MAG: rRNA maturation RNase YbeY [Legionella sp. 40-6]